jgi:hypothetical protein
MQDAQEKMGAPSRRGVTMTRLSGADGPEVTLS